MRSRGGYGQGGRDVRTFGRAGELDLPLSRTKWMVYILLLMLVLAIGDLILLGPSLGYALGFVVWYWTTMRALRWAWPDSYRSLTIALAALGVLVLWSLRGLPLLEAYWIPLRVPWPIWLKAIVLAPTLVVQVPFLLFVYKQGINMFDETWSPPKAQVQSERPLLPRWAAWMWPGPRAKQEPPLQPEGPPLFIQVEDAEGLHEEEECPLPARQNGLDVQATFFRAVVNGVKSFSRSAAMGCGFSRGDFETLDAWMLSRGYVVHQEHPSPRIPYVCQVTGRGKRFMQAVIAASRPDTPSPTGE